MGKLGYGLDTRQAIPDFDPLTVKADQSGELYCGREDPARLAGNLARTMGNLARTMDCHPVLRVDRKAVFQRDLLWRRMPGHPIHHSGALGRQGLSNSNSGSKLRQARKRGGDSPGVREEAASGGYETVAERSPT
jgi:hypothetical protein